MWLQVYRQETILVWKMWYFFKKVLKSSLSFDKLNFADTDLNTSLDLPILACSPHKLPPRHLMHMLPFSFLLLCFSLLLNFQSPAFAQEGIFLVIFALFSFLFYSFYSFSLLSFLCIYIPLLLVLNNLFPILNLITLFHFWHIKHWKILQEFISNSFLSGWMRGSVWCTTDTIHM